MTQAYRNIDFIIGKRPIVIKLNGWSHDHSRWK